MPTLFQLCSNTCGSELLICARAAGPLGNRRREDVGHKVGTECVPQDDSGGFHESSHIKATEDWEG